MHGFYHLHHLFTRKKFSTFLRRKNLKFNLQTLSDQLSRKVKSAQYKTVEYEINLEKKSSYMCKFKNECKHEHLKELLNSKQTVSRNSLFCNNLFDMTCEKIRNRNETMIIRDISSLIVSSAQTLVTYDVTHLNHLYECVNEGWNSAIPFHDTRLQLNYSVKFERSAFTEK